MALMRRKLKTQFAILKSILYHLKWRFVHTVNVVIVTYTKSKWSHSHSDSGKPICISVKGKMIKWIKINVSEDVSKQNSGRKHVH